MPEGAELWRKADQRGLLITSYKRLEKRQSVSLHTLYHQSPHEPGSCTTFMVNSHWGRAAHRVALVVSDSLRPCRLWPVKLLCHGGSPGKNTGAYWPILVAIPFQSTTFPASLATNSPEYMVLPEPLRLKQLHHFHTWPSKG